ncbi:MAG: indole-3-glycerol phosphate synthase TrpC [Candidatus Binatia bacterium]
MILDDIVAYKKNEVDLQKQRVPLQQLKDAAFFHQPTLGFLQTLRGWNGRTIIAEVKKASPSKGIIRADFDPLSLAKTYEENGAAAISVLTESKFFQGSLAYLQLIRENVSRPLLRKDFLFDPYQVYEARSFGASAILLIVAILSDSQLRELAALAQSLTLDCLIEVHDADELERALNCGVQLLGINNRDLRTFHTTSEITERLIGQVPQGVLVISESGLSRSEQLTRLEAQGVKGFLIGETFMAAADPGIPLRTLLQGDP